MPKPVLPKRLIRKNLPQSLRATAKSFPGEKQLNHAESRYLAQENLVREDLCGEAIRLAQLLASRPDTSLPKVHALLALLYFQAARLETRVDGEGNLLLLAEQERNQWDPALLALGVAQLERAAHGNELSEYHLQAAIAAVHATSASVAETNWPRLVAFYDQRLALAPSPVVALNRAVAQSMVEGPEIALASLDELSAEPGLKNYYLLPAVRADFLRRLGRTAEAAACYQEALTYPCSEPERRFLVRRIDGLNTDAGWKPGHHQPCP
jgi:predicted RNA polymerase sigma factor